MSVGCKSRPNDLEEALDQLDESMRVVVNFCDREVNNSHYTGEPTCKQCSVCEGRREVAVGMRDGSTTWEKCPECKGEGAIQYDPHREALMTILKRLPYYLEAILEHRDHTCHFDYNNGRGPSGCKVCGRYGDA